MSESLSFPDPAQYGTAGCSRNMGGGYTLEDLEKPEVWHVCGNCRQPGTNRGREDCPNNHPRASQVTPYLRREDTDGT